MAILRTKVIFLLSVVLVNCDKDHKLRDSENIAVPDSALALLRGAENRQEDGEDEIFTPNQTAIEPERVFVETEPDYDNRSEYEDPNPSGFTTESITTIDDKTGKKEARKDAKIEAEHPSTIADRAEETTLSTIDNNVYRRRDKVEDIYNASSIEDTQMETTTISSTSSTQSTTKANDTVEDAEDSTGQRNPKTENSATKPSIDKRNNAPAPPPQVSKSSTLKGWLEDSWLRPPAGILVPLRPLALNRALAVWNDLIAVEGLNLNDIVIVGYDSNGVSWRSRHNLQSSSNKNGKNGVSEALSKLLLKYQGIHSDSSADGTMRALSSATKLVPYDSALFVVTDKGAGDPQRLPLALRALVEKRLKVYTIWTDPNHPSQESELDLQQLRNISRQTEGDVLPYSLQVMDIDGSINSAEDNWHQVEYVQPRRARLYSPITRDNFDTLLVRRGGGGATSLGVPVENGVKALRVHIEGAVEHAVLYPPNDGPQIDLYNQTSVAAFSTTSKTDGYSPRDVFLGFPGADLNGDLLSVLPMSTKNGDPAPTVGLWHLSIRCDTCDYRLCISARGRIHFDSEVHGDMLHLRVTGPVSSVRESTLIDEYGTELSKLPFSYQPKAGDAQEEVPDGTDAELVADVALPKVKGSKVYVKIVGRDVRGEPFVRYSGPIYEHTEVRLSRSASLNYETDLERAEEANLRAYNSRLQYNNSNVLSNDRAASQVVNQQGTILTSVQIGLSTRLYGAPGDNLQLHFEVTNYRNQAVQFAFEAVGELRFLRAISPARQLIGAGQTVNVIVSLSITTTAQPGARDLITFTAYSANTEQVTISAYVYVVNPDFNSADVWAPEVRHNFQGSCLGKMDSDCATHVWSATVIARDAVGGLLRLASSPVGLLYDSNFISGTREEVLATYRATCCAPRVIVTAIDTYGNANSYAVDITNYFTEAAIAAIVLGVFLVIIIILLIAFLIYWCVRRSKESRELPTYSTSRSRSLG